MKVSKSEAKGMKFFEELSSGTNVLVQKDEAVDGLIEEGYNGFIFDSLEECIEKMTYIFKNQEVLLEMKKNATKTSLKYSKEKFAESVLKIYEAAIKKYKNNQE
jgi:1,2-diacylglycerol 3-alpha-glucosyltransferase